MFSAPRPSLTNLAGLLLMLTGPGCVGLSVQKQTLVAALPPGKDEVKCLLVYEDFDVIGQGEKELEIAKRDLRRLTTGKTFKLPIWPLWFSLDDTPDEAEAKQFQELLRRHLAVENGRFFKNDADQLAFWQRLTVRDAQVFVQACNERISVALARFAKEGLALDRARLSAQELRQWEKWDVETLKMLEQAARDKHRWLTLEPGRLRFTMRGSEHYFRHLKLDLLKPTDDHAAWLEWLAQLSWSLEQRKNELTISLGVGEGEPIRVVAADDRKKPRSKYHKSLMDYSQTLPVPVVKTKMADLLKELQQGR